MNIQLTAIGHYLPETIITNKMLSEKYSAFDSASILKRTGINERRYVKKETTGEMIAYAVTDMQHRFGIKTENIELVIVGTCTPDYVLPSTAASVIKKTGAKKAWGFDVSSACSGFCYALHIATKMMKEGNIKTALVCGGDKMSALLNNEDYKTGILFADGAAAVLLHQTDDEHYGIVDSVCNVVSDDIDDIYYKSPWGTENWNEEKFELEGQKVFKNGIRLIQQLINEYLRSKGKSIDDFDYIVPHQSNLRMLAELARELNIDLDKMLINIENVGNTSAASIPLCLSQKYAEGKLKKGDRLLLASFGSGYANSVVEMVWGI